MPKEVWRDSRQAGKSGIRRRAHEKRDVAAVQQAVTGRVSSDDHH